MKVNAKPVSKNAGGILSKLWRKILNDNNLYRSLNILISRAINKQHANKRTKIMNKKSISNNVESTSMTLKVFVELLNDVLGVTRSTMYIKLDEDEPFNLTVNKDEDLKKLLDNICKFYKIADNRTKFLDDYISSLNCSEDVAKNKRQAMNSYLSGKSISFKNFYYVIDQLIKPRVIILGIRITMVTGTSYHEIKILIRK